MDTVHDPGVLPDWAGTVPPLNEKEVVPATAVTEVPQVVVKPTGLAMESPEGKVSVHEAFVSGNAFGLKMVTLRRDTAPAAIDIGEKLLFISAGKDIWACTVPPGVTRMETMRTIVTKSKIDLRIGYPFSST